jgi:hypothetical protein
MAHLAVQSRQEAGGKVNRVHPMDSGLVMLESKGMEKEAGQKATGKHMNQN